VGYLLVFDQHDMQLLNNFGLCFLGLATNILGIWGRVIYCCKGLENTFPMLDYTPQNFIITAAKKERIIHS
jgi:hypothetical protein